MEITLILLSLFLVQNLSIWTPGQDFALITQTTLSSGKKSGFFIGLGTNLSEVFMALLAIWGMGKFISLNENLLPIIQTAGSIYLIYFGAKIFRNAQGSDQKEISGEKKLLTNSKAFLIGAGSCFTNAEIYLFIITAFSIIIPIDFPLWAKLAACFIIFCNNILWATILVNIFSLKKFQNFLFNYKKRIEQTLGILLLFLGFKNLHKTA